MDTPNPTPTPEPDPRSEARQLIWGVVGTFIFMLLLVALFTLIIQKSGKGNYFNQTMERESGQASH